MKIILTIKSLLNYLYNNLIDLIKVKKIVFEDGTEQDSASSGGSFLFDIKRRSIDDISDEKLVQKGWCCISESQPKRLAKADVPTVYEFLKDKFEGIDSEVSDTPTTLVNSNDSNAIDYDDTYLYTTPSSRWYDGVNNVWNLTIKRTLIKDLPITNWETTNINIINANKGTPLCVGENFIVTYHRELNKIQIHKKSDFSLFKQINIKNGIANITKAVVDNKKTFFMSYYDTNNQYCLAKIEDDLTSDIEILTTSLDGISSNPMQVGINSFIFCSNGKIYKTTDNFQTYTQLSTTPSGTVDETGSIYKINDVLIATGKDSSTVGYQISLDKGETWNNGSAFVNIAGINPNGWCDGKELYVFVHYNDWANCRLYHTGDLLNWERVGTFSVNGGSRVSYDIKNKNIYYNNPSTLTYIGIIKTIYTDTINGIDIKYYKNGDWKICTPTIAVGNDDNLQSVYEYLGYLNYWWIDTTNEKITLQRDSAFETYMYVGDDYEDDILPSGSYIPYATKQDVGNAGHTIIHKFIGYSGLTLDTEISLGNSCIIFKNGNKLSIVDDYTINGTIITFLTPLITSDKIEIMFGDITSIDLSQFKQKAQTIEINTASVTIDNVLANKNYVLSNNAITDITLTACETSMEKTTIQFTTGSSAPTLTDNSGLVWFGGIPTLQANTTYVIEIFNKQAFYQVQGV